MSLLFLLLFYTIRSASATLSTTGQSLNYVHIYLNRSITWFEANEYCLNSFNTVLATIISSEQNGEAAYLLNIQNSEEELNSSCSLIGLTDLHSSTKWRWIDNTKANYTNWAINEPSDIENNGCASMCEHGTWYSLKCQSKCNRCSILCNAPNMYKSTTIIPLTSYNINNNTVIISAPLPHYFWFVIITIILLLITIPILVIGIMYLFFKTRSINKPELLQFGQQIQLPTTKRVSSYMNVDISDEEKENLSLTDMNVDNYDEEKKEVSRIRNNDNVNYSSLNKKQLDHDHDASDTYSNEGADNNYDNHPIVLSTPYK